MEVGFTKDEERELLRTWGYPVWNLPAGACLATVSYTHLAELAGRLHLGGDASPALNEILSNEASVIAGACLLYTSRCV